MNRKKKYNLKLTAIILSICVNMMSISPQAAEAGNFFSDLFGGILTIITAPILLVAPDNPTLRKNNPFRKKVWEEQVEEEQKEKEREERYRKTVAPPQPATQDYENIIAKLQAQLNGQQKKIEGLENQKNEPPPSNKPPKARKPKLTREQWEELVKCLTENLSEAVDTYFESHLEELRGAAGRDGVDGKDGRSFGLEDFEEAFNNNEGFRNWVNSNLRGERGAAGRDGKDGRDGAKGDKDDPGAIGAKGDKGDKGDTGKNGRDGADFNPYKPRPTPSYEKPFEY